MATVRTPNGRGVGLSLAFALLLFVVGSDLGIVAPLLGDIRRSLHVSLAEGGLLVTAFAAAYAVGSPWIGWLADRYGRWPILALGTTAFVVLEGLCAVAPSYPVLLAARAATGLTAAALSPTAYAVLGDVTAFSERARAMSVASTGFSLATVAGVPLGLALATVLGWRAVLGALSLAAALTGVVTLHSVRSALSAAPQDLAWALPEAVPVAAARAAPPAARPLPAPPRPTPAWVFGESLAAFAIVGLVYTYAVAGLQHRFGWSPAVLAWLLLAYGLCNAGGNLLLGRLGDRFGKVAAVGAGQAAEALALAGFAWAVADHRAAAAALTLAAFGLTQAYIPNLKALASDVPPERRGRSLAWNNAAMYGGLMAGSWVASRLYAQAGLSGLAWLGCAVALLALTGVASGHLGASHR